MSLVRSRCGLWLASGAAILVLALLAVLFLLTLGGRAGPRHEGKTLRQWIEAMDSQNPSAQTQALAAVRLIGTNALPTLIEWMAHRDSDYHGQFYKLLHSRRAMAWTWPKLMRNSEESCEYRALLGFYALGPVARPALPSLEQLVRADGAASPAKPLNAARAYVYVAPAEAERLAEQWSSSTNQDLLTAGSRLKGALASVQGMAASSNKVAARNDGSATSVGNSDDLGVARPR